ncbi:MAG: sodium/pantothenate symporter [Firmicutes bacterium]|nr:sodium/pantothenate symporter [Bacillota bacterium]MDD3850714.1 sodium/pantothenate symporter [Bacillota bacterium]MDD4707964.1 sodium/pantothenate symporter [Bacillota bacterium]
MGIEIGNSARLAIIITFAIYTVILLGIGIYTKKMMDKTAVDKYVDEFYTGGRGMGSLVIALMIAAGLCSAGTFLGGPGMGYSMGLAWVFAGFSQNFMNFCVLGQIGKKVGIVARRINAQSYLDLFVHRYNHNKIIGIVGVLSIIVFLGGYVVAQFVGGARLFETMTGLPYWVGLSIFALVVLLYAAFGGIKGVSTAIVFQGLVMTAAVFALFIGALRFIGPIEPAIRSIGEINPDLITPWSWSIKYQASIWVIFGLVMIALPHGAMGALTYKDTKSMHKAIILGVVFVVIWTFILIWLGHMVRAVYPDLAVPDHAIPLLAMTVLPPWLAGITLAGVAGAIQSTVGAMIIVISSTFVKDAYQTYINPKAKGAQLKKVTTISTVVICAAIFLLSLNPPTVLEWIIIFTVGGLASAFFWPLILGLYWMRANEHGASAGMVSGMLTYILAAGNYLPISMGMHPIVISLIVSAVIMIVVSLATPKSPKGIIQTWFGKRYPKQIGN